MLLAQHACVAVAAAVALRCAHHVRTFRSICFVEFEIMLRAH
jgi:hypothetical protein